MNRLDLIIDFSAFIFAYLKQCNPEASFEIVWINFDDFKLLTLILLTVKSFLSQNKSDFFFQTNSKLLNVKAIKLTLKSIKFESLKDHHHNESYKVVKLDILLAFQNE